MDEFLPLLSSAWPDISLESQDKKLLPTLRLRMTNGVQCGKA